MNPLSRQHKMLYISALIGILLLLFFGLPHWLTVSTVFRWFACLIVLGVGVALALEITNPLRLSDTIQGVIWLGLPTILLIALMVHYTFVDHRDLKKNGVITQGIIVNKNVEMSGKNNRFKSYDIKCSFEVNGKTYTTLYLPIYKAEYQTLEIGDTVPVRYSSVTPNNNEIHLK